MTQLRAPIEGLVRAPDRFPAHCRALANLACRAVQPHRSPRATTRSRGRSTQQPLRRHARQILGLPVDLPPSTVLAHYQAAVSGF